MKIDELTQAQVADMRHHAQHWINIGLASGASNRAVVEPIITDFYTRARLDEPAFIYAQSPYAGQVIANKLNKAIAIDSVENSTIEIKNSLLDSALDIETAVWDSAWKNVWIIVEKIVDENVSNSVYDTVQNNLRNNRLVYYAMFDGSYDIVWLSFYVYLDKHFPALFDTTQKAQLQQWTDLKSNIGFWIPLDGVCIVCDRPDYTLLDQDGKLHSLSYTAPAIRFMDGYSIYAEHGRVHTARIIKSDKEITQ